MKTKFLKAKIKYDGTQLKSLYSYLNHKILGDSCVAFRGACNVSFEHMLDGEDLLAKEKICGSDMIHFIIEVFDRDLHFAVALQRLFSSICKDVLENQTQHKISRSGDDLYFGKGKLSISIATKSPVSSMIHFAVNVSNKGTPVKTASLEDLGVKPQAFVLDVLKRVEKEYASISEASKKVRPVN